MITYKDIKEFYNDVKHDKPMIWILRIGITVLIIAFILSYADFRTAAAKGEHIKYFWIERNIPKGYPDTVYQKIPCPEKIAIKSPGKSSPPSPKSTSKNKSDTGGIEINGSPINRSIIGGSGNTIK